jgi:hypothetical protein
MSNKVLLRASHRQLMKRDLVVLHGNHAPLGECERVIFKNSENEFRYGRTFQSLQS